MSCYNCRLAKPLLACSYNHVRVIKRKIVVLELLAWKGWPVKAMPGDLTMPKRTNHSCACGEYGCTRDCGGDSL